MRVVIISSIFLYFLSSAHSTWAAATPTPAPMTSPIPTDDNDDVQSKDPTRQLQNLIFYPHKSEYRLNPQLITQINYTATTEAGGVKTLSETQSYYEVTIMYVYGLTNRLRLGATETDLFDRSTTTTTESTGAQANTDASGLSDPTLSASYRYLQNYHRGVFADLTLAVTPQVARKELATQSQNGNNFNGGTTASLSLPVFFHNSRNEVELNPAVFQSFGSYGYGANDAESNKMSAFTSASIALTDRYHFNRDIFLSGVLQYTFPYTYELTPRTPGAAPVEHKPAGTLIETLTFGYMEDFHTLFMLSLSFNTANGGTDTNTTKAVQSYANIDLYMYY